MFVSLALPLLGLSSCSTDVKDWEMKDPNESAMMAADIKQPRAYSKDSVGLERKTMTDREIRELTRKKESDVKFSGEIGIGVGTNF